jgi:hypothetical protein
VYTLLKRNNFFGRYAFISFSLICVVFIYPYREIGKKVYRPTEYSWDTMYPISELLQDAFHKKTTMNNRVIAYKDYDQHLKVYTDALRDRGQRLYYKQPEHLSPGDTVMASEKQVFELIESKYKFNMLRSDREVNIYLIK